MGTKRGDTLLGPFSMIFVCSDSKVEMPPIPVPKITLNLSGSTLPFMPLSFTACSAAPSASCVYLSVRSISLTSRYSAGSKPFTSAASFAFKLSVLKNVTGAIPFFPFLSASHVSFVLFPTGVIAPSPVTTTLLKFSFMFLSLFLFFYIAIPPSTFNTSPVT